MIVHESDVDEFLAHYGVPGMKWGHHKSGGSGKSGGGHSAVKKAFKTGAAAAVVVGGAGASAYVLHKYGAKKAIEVGMKSVKTAQKIKGFSDTVKSDYGYQKPSKVPDSAMSQKVNELHLESFRKYNPPKPPTAEQIAKALKDPSYDWANDPKPWN